MGYNTQYAQCVFILPRVKTYQTFYYYYFFSVIAVIFMHENIFTKHLWLYVTISTSSSVHAATHLLPTFRCYHIAFSVCSTTPRYPQLFQLPIGKIYTKRNRLLYLKTIETSKTNQKF